MIVRNPMGSAAQTQTSTLVLFERQMDFGLVGMFGAVVVADGAAVGPRDWIVPHHCPWDQNWWYCQGRLPAWVLQTFAK